MRAKLFFHSNSKKNGDFGDVFQPRRASGFEMRKVFQASQNTTCYFLSKIFLLMVF
jgi:hypothetical protein